MISFPRTRLRRLRHEPILRRLVQEIELSINHLVLPLFIHEGISQKKPINSLPDHYQLSLKDLPEEVATISAAKIPAVILFGIPEHKDEIGTSSYDTHGIIPQAIQQIRNENPNLLIIADTCVCAYTSHGHCGIVKEYKQGLDIDNDRTLELLQRQALTFAAAGADVIAPSSMTDGVVGAIREALDQENFEHIPILSYSVKYASSLYGPFREAAGSSPQFGNRKSYQMSYTNRQEALREAQLDLEEGADLLMVKPASFYLDIIADLHHTYPAIPLAAYQVSGEYAMLKAAAKSGWIDFSTTLLESLVAIRRAGAQFIISYGAKEIAPHLT